MNDELQNLFSWPEICTIHRRVIRQLIQSLIHERLIVPVIQEEYSDYSLLKIVVESDDPSAHYFCKVKIGVGFQAYRLLKDPVIKVWRTGREEASIHGFLNDFQYLFSSQERFASFASELEQTWLNDSLSSWHLYKESIKTNKHENYTANLNDYTSLESRVSDGHPYHPSYKSRIGFGLQDHECFAPEFGNAFPLIWLAVHRDLATISVSSAVSYSDFIQREIGEALFRTFIDKLQAQEKSVDDFIFFPVHPWQWDEVILRHYYHHFVSGEILYLGKGEDLYIPQQSIRTLSNRTDPQKSFVKTALNIVNTSAKRIIGPHHAQNAPKLSDWLQTIVESDDVFQQEVRFAILKEIVGVSFRYDEAASISSEQKYGTLGAIWREPFLSKINQGEGVVPVTAIGHVSLDGKALIEPWVQLYGLETWVHQLLKVTIKPFLHLLYKYGVGVEAHAQNMLLIHREGMPVGIMFRDLPGGILCLDTQDFIDRPSLPSLVIRDEDCTLIRNGLLTNKPEDARDFFMDAFFHIFLNELAAFLDENYNFEALQFWKLAAAVILEYQEAHNDQLKQFQAFDLFTPTIEVGKLTARKILGDQVKQDHVVNNPLFHVKVELETINS
jgi:siderophore synthetase component